MKNHFRFLRSAACLLIVLISATISYASPESDRAAADAVLTNRHTFPEGLVWTGTQPPAGSETDAVLEILAKLHTPEWIALTEGFVAANPASPWTPALEHSYASFCRRTGRTTKALNYWESSWNTLRSDQSPQSRKLAAAVLSGWLQLLSSLGRLDQLERLLPEAEALAASQPGLNRQLMSAKGNYQLMRNFPGKSFRCGTLALKSVGLAIQPTNAALANLVSYFSPTNGFSIEELERFSRDLHLGLVAVQRPRGTELVVPSVVHWQQNHYAALLAKKGDSIYVNDPTFETAKWISASVVNEEASGVFLVPTDKIPSGWKVLDEGEKREFHGRGLPESVKDGNDRGCPKGKDCNCKGMPIWWVTEPYINLFIADEPLSYLTSKGEQMDFRFTYKQRDTRPNLDGSRDGWINPTGWNHSWFSYIRTISKTPYQQFSDWRDYNDSTSVIYLPGGGEMQFDSLTGTDPESGVRMAPCSPNYYYNLIDTSIQYPFGSGGLRLTYPDGTQDIYNVCDGEEFLGNDYPKFDFFWTQRITQNGDVIRLTYTKTDAFAFQVQYVVDPDGKTNTFHYSSQRQVSQVDSPYGASAYFGYDSYTNVTSITDSEGNSSTLSYDTNGYPTTLVTPYGTNTFNILEQIQTIGGSSEGNAGGHDFITRAITATDPAGGSDMYLYRYNSTFLADTISTNELPVGTPLGTLDDGNSGTNTLGYVSYRNSFHWNPRQYSALSTTVATNLVAADYLLGHRSHWLEDTNALTLSSVLSFEQDPSPNGSNGGLKTFYDYSGKATPYQVGSTVVPAVVAWRYPGGATYYQWSRYNDWGVLTNLVTTYTKTDGTVGTRTNSWLYIQNNYTNVLDQIGLLPAFTNSWSIPNLLTAIIGPDGQTNWNFGGFDYIQWSLVYPNPSYASTNVVTIYSSRVIPSAITNAVKDITQLYFTGLNKIAGIKWPTTLTTTNFYDTNGFLSRTVDVEPTRTNTFTYGANGLVTTWTDPLGRIQTNMWDTLLRLRSAADDRGYISNNYSALSLVGQRDRLGNWKYYGYDAANRLTAITNELSQKTFLGWCLCGSLETITNALGEVTVFNRDQQSRLTGMVLSTSPSIVYSFGIDLAGRMTNATDSANTSYQFYYNNQGLLTTVSNLSGTVAKALYDIRDRPIQLTSAAGTTVTNTYDLLNRVLTRQLPVGNPERFTYIAAGLSRYTNQLGFGTGFGYDPSGLLIVQTNANLEVIQMAYNPVGNLTNLIDGKSQQTSWQFDKFGRVTNKIDNTSASDFKYSYNANNRLTNRWTPAKGNTAYGYNAANQLTSIGYPSMGTVTTGFDALGRLTNLVDALGTTRWTYSRLGAVASEDGPWDSDKVSSTYGLAHYLTAVNIARPNAGDWIQSFGYDSVGRLTNTTSPAGSFGYGFLNASTLITRLALGNGAVVTNGYDSDSRLASTWLRNGSGTALDSHSYGYNDAHWRTAVTNFASNG